MVTIDPRPTVFGDRMIVTGTYDTTDGERIIDFSDKLSSIDAFIINPASRFSMVVEQVSNIDNDGGGANNQIVFTSEFGTKVSDTTLMISPPIRNEDLKGGTFLIIGRRS
jgi:hypothetical protein